MKRFILNEEEINLLFKQDPETKGEGGFQSLMVKLQNQFNPEIKEIELDVEDLERIPRYAFDYGNGGWENRLVGIFSRHMGSLLGR